MTAEISDGQLPQNFANAASLLDTYVVDASAQLANLRRSLGIGSVVYTGDGLATTDERFRGPTPLVGRIVLGGCVGFILVFLFMATAIPSSLSVWVAVSALGGLATAVIYGLIIGPIHDRRTIRPYHLLAESVVLAEKLHKATVVRVNVEFDRERQKLLSQYERQRNELVKREERLEQIHDEIRQFNAGVESCSPGWGADHWEKWEPPSDLISSLRFGEISIGYPSLPSMPAVFPFPGNGGMIIESTGSGKDSAVFAAQSLLLRLLVSIPPGRAFLTFLDPVGLGQNVAGFTRLGDFNEMLVNGKVWTESHHIEQRLADLTEHMEYVIQKHLRNKYPSIEQYNLGAGEIAEPYRILMIFDFPINFSEEATRRLLSIARNGPRCGVYTLIVTDSTQSPPGGFTMADLEAVSTVVSWSGERFIWEDGDLANVSLCLDRPPAPEVFQQIVETAGQAAVVASKVEVPFSRIAPSRGTVVADHFWKWGRCPAGSIRGEQGSSSQFGERDRHSCPGRWKDWIG